MADPAAQEPGPPFSTADILNGAGVFVLAQGAAVQPEENIDAGPGVNDVAIEEV